MLRAIFVLPLVALAVSPCMAQERCAPLASTSDLPGVNLVIASRQCSFSQAELRAGVRLEYELVVQRELTGLVPLPQDLGGCQQPNLAGLITFRSITGSNHSFCPQCDLGPCPPRHREAVTLRPGRYREAILWRGLTYLGPSDGMSTVPRREFPPGRYVVHVSLRGTRRLSAAKEQAPGSFKVELQWPVEVRR